jgi:hypothetical protein
MHPAHLSLDDNQGGISQGISVIYYYKNLGFTTGLIRARIHGSTRGGTRG